MRGGGCALPARTDAGLDLFWHVQARVASCTDEVTKNIHSLFVVAKGNEEAKSVIEEGVVYAFLGLFCLGF